MSTESRLDKDDVAHIHSVTLLSCKRKNERFICSNMDELIDDHTK